MGFRPKKILIVINLEYSAWSLAIINGNLVTGLSDGTLKVYDINSGSLLLSCKEHEDSITSISVNQQKIITAAKDKTIKIWDVNNLNLLKSIPAHNAAIWSVLSNDNSIISASDDKTIRIFNMDGYLKESLSGNSDWIAGLAQSPAKIVAGLGNGTIKIWFKKPKNSCETINLENLKFEKSPFDTEKEANEKEIDYKIKTVKRLLSYDYIISVKFNLQLKITL